MRSTQRDYYEVRSNERIADGECVLRQTEAEFQWWTVKLFKATYLSRMLMLTCP